MSIDNDPTLIEPDEEPRCSYQPGDVFGQYAVLRLLGRGAMGEVYAVRHRVLGSVHAIKLISRKVLSSGTAVERFKREAKAMCQLRHPSIVHVDDFGETDGRYWLRMELVGGSETNEGAGLTLGEKLKAANGKLNENEVRAILRQILEALAYAHGEGVVHRDLKPANILMDSSGALKIADFGLVRFVGEKWLQSQVQLTVVQSMIDPDATLVDNRGPLSEEETMVEDSNSGSTGKAGSSTRALMGTYAFMSPEQRRGEEADHRSDLYAVGLMAYQMLTGAESLSLKAPSRLDSSIDPAWDDWVERATEANAKARFADASEMLASMPKGAVKAPAKKSKPASSWMWVAAAVLFLSLGLFGYWWIQQQEIEPSPVADTQPLDEALALEAVAEIEDSAAILEPPSGSLELSLENEALRSGEGVKVMLDNREINQPWRNGILKIEGLEVGQRTLQISHNSHHPHSSQLTIRDQQTTRHRVSLDPLPGQLTLQVSGPAAGEWSVEVNGEATTLARGNLLELPAGQAHTIRVSARGWQAWEQSVTLGAAERRTLSPRLEEARGPVAGQNAEVDLPGGVKLDMVWIRPGEFVMGSPDNESGRMADREGPQTRVRISQGYWLGKYPVTQGQWQALMGNNPSHFKGSNLPVERVSWNDAMEFCKRLNDQERRAGRLPSGYTYTLPSEGQWEYAARAGTTTRFYTGNSDSDLERAGWFRGNAGGSWFSGNAGGSTKAVGQKVPNAWGLYDIHGNVWEWTRSWYGNYPGGSVEDYEGPASGSFRVLRGGSWSIPAQGCRSAYRGRYTPGIRYFNLGFRLALAPTLN